MKLTTLGTKFTQRWVEYHLAEIYIFNHETWYDDYKLMVGVDCVYLLPFIPRLHISKNNKNNYNSNNN